MNVSLMILELAVVCLGLGLLVVELWTPPAFKRALSLGAIVGLGLILLFSFWIQAPQAVYAFGQMYVLDGLALFFKRLFLAAALGVLIMSREFGESYSTGVIEYQALVLFALAGMMSAASANDFTVMFVSIELISVTFYVLIGYEKSRAASLEAGVKYLILGGVASAFLVYGIALIFGSAGTTSFQHPSVAAGTAGLLPLFLVGLVLVMVGLGFKIAAVPFQIWTPDVYQGAPTATTAFLAIGSKAAGFVLLLRVLLGAASEVTPHWRPLLMTIAAMTILYGNLCAIPQRSLKRLLGYSSIANAGYLLLGVAALSTAGASAILFYLGGYLFSLLAAFLVIGVVIREMKSDDIGSVAGLHQRSPLLAAGLTLAMVSLAGIPPFVGFFGKFLLLKAVVEQGATQSGYFWLVAAALLGIVVSLYYYFGVVRAIYWSKTSTAGDSSLEVSPSVRLTLGACMAGMLFLGVMPRPLLAAAEQAVKVLYGN